MQHDVGNLSVGKRKFSRFRQKSPRETGRGSAPGPVIATRSMSSQTRWRWWSRVGKLTESKMDVVENDESEVDDEDTVDNDDEDV